MVWRREWRLRGREEFRVRGEIFDMYYLSIGGGL
jgi:hypothetical protein